ncbi:hypothetical protein [uncultured Fluviicola sp.]|uniref:DUF6924 domain-containing protein n=1 Tax=uncultured Fluviicola sp. TaxID=463303 RepID=UPI0025FA50C2|nr:hypothetical protein [uncultured Fluviicola sp.]
MMNKTRNTIFTAVGFLIMSFSVTPKNCESMLNIPTEIVENLPDSKDPLVIRTFFGNDKDWHSVSEKLTKSYEMGFKAYVELLDDRRFRNLTPEEIVELSKPHYKHTFIFVADSLTFSNSENTVLCIDLYNEIGKSFRVIPSEMWAVENNLSIANMDFHEFYESCDADGVFRGFE